MEINAEKIRNVLFWITILILIFLLVWYVFGSSPTLEQITFTLTLLFLFFFWDERKSRKSIDAKLNKLDNIYMVLKNMEKK